MSIEKVYIEKKMLGNGVCWVEVPEAGLKLLCGAPPDAVKLLRKHGLIQKTSSQGKTFETGPNAILLSDQEIQGGLYKNFAEFPVLQMLHLQGRITPGHPNNNGQRPMLIGSPEQLSRQLKYIHYGNYGLCKPSDWAKANVGLPERAHYQKIKLDFAFGKVVPAEQLLAPIALNKDPVSLGKGLSLARKSTDVFVLSYRGQQVTIDLQLNAQATLKPTYQLAEKPWKPTSFGVLHLGEGDGWDTERPCMASLLMVNGQFYLIDAGPNVIDNLSKTGLSVKDLDGIFMTHAHDDHFADLPNIGLAKKKIPLIASEIVLDSIAHKYGALLGKSPRQLSEDFSLQALPLNQKTKITDQFWATPFLSPHPIETNAYTFAYGTEGQKTYSHLADTIALSKLAGMCQKTTETQASSLSEYLQEITARYLAPATLKKVDVGQGMIHGDPQDFVDDRSSKILLAHTNGPIKLVDNERATIANFGDIDVLAAATENFWELILTKFGLLAVLEEWKNAGSFPPTLALSGSAVVAPRKVVILSGEVYATDGTVYNAADTINFNQAEQQPLLAAMPVYYLAFD